MCEALAGDELMVQGIDDSSVSPCSWYPHSYWARLRGVHFCPLVAIERTWQLAQPAAVTGPDYIIQTPLLRKLKQSNFVRATQRSRSWVIRGTLIRTNHTLSRARFESEPRRDAWAEVIR